MSREMNGPAMIQQMQEYFQQNPSQYKQFMNMQQNMQVIEEEKKKAQMSPKEKLDLAKDELKGKRM